MATFWSIGDDVFLRRIDTTLLLCAVAVRGVYPSVSFLGASATQVQICGFKPLDSHFPKNVITARIDGEKRAVMVGPFCQDPDGAIVMLRDLVNYFVECERLSKASSSPLSLSQS
jgi:hypothetical protein